MIDFKKHIIRIFILFCVLSMGIGIGYVFGKNNEHNFLVKNLASIRPIRQANSSYKFINPLLAYIVPSADKQDQFLSLKNNISGIIDYEKSQGNITNASVYFYDLNRSRWIGINETDKYSPASMLKVIIMVAYFKKAEKDPTILNSALAYSSYINDHLEKNPFFSVSSLKIDQEYSVEDLIKKMIIDSDNGAELLLLDFIDQNSLNDIYKSLHIQGPDDIDGDFVISPRLYSLFFRILYSSTYLSEEMSEKALGILSQTTFTNGLVAKLPGNILVAHKFGERVLIDSNKIQNVELHDCGIVYKNPNPYFICVMTKGSDITKLEEVIKNISGATYKEYVNYSPN